MYVEYCIYNKLIEDYDKEKIMVYKALENGITGIAAPIHFIREIKDSIPTDIALIAPIDYPLGYSSAKVRNHMVLNSVQSGATIVDYVMNHYLLKNKPEDALKELQTAFYICQDNGASLRIFIDSETFPNIIDKAGEYFNLGIEVGYPCMGYHHEDFNETVLNAKVIEVKSQILTIFNGQIWQKEQIELIKNSNLFGLRLYTTKFWCN